MWRSTSRAMLGVLLFYSMPASANPSMLSMSFPTQREAPDTVTLTDVANRGVYIVRLTGEKDVSGNDVVVDLSLSAASNASKTNLLEPKGHWHGYQPFFFAASDFAKGIDKSIFGRIRSIPIWGTKLSLSVDVQGLEVVALPAKPKDYRFEFIRLGVGLGPMTWRQQQTLNMRRAVGRFTNVDYGFSIELPPDAASYVTNGGDANHGVRLILGDFRTIDVYPQYTGIIPGDDLPCRRHQFPWQDTSNPSVQHTSIGHLLGCIATFQEGDRIWRIVQAVGNDRGTGILYSLLLTTNRQSLDSDVRVFNRVSESFRRVPIQP